MIAWWDSLDTIMRVLYCIAIPATVVLVIQLILSLAGGFEGGAGVDVSDTSGLGGDMGMDFDGGADLGELADGDIGGHESIFMDGGNPADFSIASMFSLQGIVTFLTVLGWSAILSIEGGAAPMAAILVGCALGLLAMYLVARLMFASRKLTENGSIDLRNAIGENGRVYIPVPAGGSGEGKITMYLQGRYGDYPCIYFGEDTVPTGTAVRIVDLRGDVFVIERDQ